MIFDELLKVSQSQAVTASAVSTDTIDLSQNRDIGAGEELYMHFTVNTAPTAVGLATVDFQVISSAAANLGSPTVLGSSGPIEIASLPIGTRVAVKINPRLLSTGQRYLGANFAVATGPLTAGAFSAGIVKDVQDNKNYPSGYTVA